MSTSSSSKNITQFLDRNQATWSKLESVLRSLGRKPKPQQLTELSQLYRQVSVQLAYAQTHFPTHEIIEYLQSLVIRSHNIIYGAKKKNEWQAVGRFFWHEFPMYFYQRASFFVIALAFVMFGFVLAYFLTLIDDSFARAFLGDLAPLHPDEVSQREWNHALTSSTIMVNNIYVAFFCFAWGALLGIGTVWTLFVNGAMIGSLAALYQQIGGNYIFWAYIWPHGVIELTAIFIAGAAGLSLAYRFFVPGELTRFQAFKQEGKVTIKLVFGVIPMFFIAAIIEGYITAAPWPYWSKYLFAAGTLLLLTIYLGRPFLQSGIVKTSTANKQQSTVPLPPS